METHEHIRMNRIQGENLGSMHAVSHDNAVDIGYTTPAEGYAQSVESALKVRELMQAARPELGQGVSVSLDDRDTKLITVMDKWSEANKLDGLAEGMQTTAHRARLGANDELALNATDKARKLRSEARNLFEEATGVRAMIEAGYPQEAGDIDAELLIISFFSDFRERFLSQPSALKNRRKLHKSNTDKRHPNR